MNTLVDGYYSLLCKYLLWNEGLQAFICSNPTVKQTVHHVEIADDARIRNLLETISHCAWKTAGKALRSVCDWLLGSPKKRIGQQVHIRCNRLSLAHFEAANKDSSRADMHLATKLKPGWVFRIGAASICIHFGIDLFLNADNITRTLFYVTRDPLRLILETLHVEVAWIIPPFIIASPGLRRLFKQLSRLGIW